MEHINKQGERTYNFRPSLSLGVLNLFQISERICTAGNEIPLHRQSCHELTCIVEGEGLFRNNDVDCPVRAGQLHLASAEETHYIRASRSTLRFFCVGFTFNKEHADYAKYAATDAFFSAPDRHLCDDRYATRRRLSDALGELEDTRALGEEMLQLMLLQVLICAYRSFNRGAQEERMKARESRVTPLLNDMTRYIDEHIGMGTVLSDMASELGYNYSYLSRRFSSVMGMTLKQYYDQSRFERAVELLMQNEPLGTVAEQTGFADTASFCKAFKRYYHVSPGRYRKRLKN